MSKKQWMVLLMLFLIYLLLGALIFHHIESQLEQEKKETLKTERAEIHGLLKQHIPKEEEKNIYKKLESFCKRPIDKDDKPEHRDWDFYNSFYFAYTVVSTIGYGNLAPTNTLSRVLMMLYAIIGIPMNGILLSQLGEFFGQVFVTAHKKYKSYKDGKIQYPQKITPLETGKAGLVAQIFMYLSPGFITFIFFPAFIFSHFEKWGYVESVYYAFVTLTTIGFGDYVAGQENKQGNNELTFIIYQVFLIAWLSFGLGYIFMIMTFISRGMRSKRIVKIEHKLAINLKQTQSKIWNEFHKEIDYLRRVFNELQLSKVKRVYVNEYDYNIPSFKLSRSNSFPDMRDLTYSGFERFAPPHPRRRANSEVVQLDDEVTRVVSETDLQRIDKKATFATHAMIQPAELLARLVNILGYIPPPTDDDDEVTKLPDFGEKDVSKAASRRNSGWILGGDFNDEKTFPVRRRTRAISEVGLEKRSNFGQDGEWTWSGPTATKKIQELMKARSKSEVSGVTATAAAKESKSKFPALPKVVLPKWVRQLAAKKTSDGESVSHAATSNDANDTSEGRSHLLEETSVAEFLRALTALHVGYTFHAGQQETLQRKLENSTSKPVSSLMALFSPPSSSVDRMSISQSQQNTFQGKQNSRSRRFSLVSAAESEIHSSSPTEQKQGPGRFRRYSLRPVVSPTGTPPQYSSYLSIDECSNPPPYSTDPFVLNHPKEPLMGSEKAPITTSSILGRFSLRPAQIEASTSASPIPTRALPRWKASLIQRQISQRRSRAFSLSDVHSDIPPIRTTSISPLAIDPAKPISEQREFVYPSRKYTGRSSIHTIQKTVTIMSPESVTKDAGSESDSPLPSRKISQTSDSGSEAGFNYSFARARRETSTTPTSATSDTADSSKSSDVTAPFISTNPFAEGSKVKKRQSHSKSKSESDSSGTVRTIFQYPQDNTSSKADAALCKDINKLSAGFNFADEDVDEEPKVTGKTEPCEATASSSYVAKNVPISRSAVVPIWEVRDRIPGDLEYAGPTEIKVEKPEETRRERKESASEEQLTNVKVE